jgi:hypothetical protein
MGPARAVNGWYQGDDGEMPFEVGARLGHEGVVAKRLDPPYLPGQRTRNWLNRKTRPGWRTTPGDGGLEYRRKDHRDRE